MYLKARPIQQTARTGTDRTASRYRFGGELLRNAHWFDGSGIYGRRGRQYGRRAEKSGGRGGRGSPETDGLTDRQEGVSEQRCRAGISLLATGGMTSTSAGRRGQGRSGGLNECNWTRGPEYMWLKYA